jgi:GNAT superfamily N-acetyltransferase
MRRSDFAGPEDLRAMQQMCSRLWSPSSRFHPGQLAWNRYSSSGGADPLEVDEAISLWREGSQVVGFGWADSPDWLELQVDPAHPEVADEVVEWFEEWSDADQQSALVMDGDASEPALEAAGFEREPAAWHLTHHLLGLAQLSEAPAVAGYTFRPVTGPQEAGPRAACHASSWSDFGPSTVTEETYSAVMAAWPYRSDLDWVAVAPDGTMVASCLVWLDPATGVGLVEPVGCVPGHRGQGLARAVILAALRRLREVGGRTALVSPRGDEEYTGPRRLYESLGFRSVARTMTWTRSLGS